MVLQRFFHQMPVLAPAVIVFEKAPRWEAELKRRLANRQLLVRPCRTAQDVLTLAGLASGSIVVIDFDAGAAEGLRILEGLLRLRLAVWSIVIGTRETDPLEWVARDLGAAAYASGSVGGAGLADTCRRALSRAAPGWPGGSKGSPRGTDGM
jgi:ActR/RegA family two-component response regulator